VHGSGVFTRTHLAGIPSLTAPIVAALVGLAVAPAPALGMASAELYTTSSYLYGRFDARVQFAPGDGVVSSFFLWKNGSATNTYWNELDYEKIDADCHVQLNNIYGEPSVQHQSTPTLNFNLCGGYHDYRFEWTPTYISWVVDGQEIRRDTGAAATAYAQNASAGMTIHFNIWPGNSTFGGNINNTTLPVHQYISLVEYSSYDSASGDFTLQWSESFQASGLPSGWAAGTWASPYNLSTDTPQDLSFINDVAVLSLTADNATGYTGTPPVDTGVGGSQGSGGSVSTGGAAGSAGVSGAAGTGEPGGSSSSGGASVAGGTTGSGGAVGSGGLPISDAGIGSGGATTPSVGSGGTESTGGTTAGGTSTMGGGAPGGTRAGGSRESTSGSIGAGGSGASGSGGSSTALGGNSSTQGPVAGSAEAAGTASSGCSCSTTRAPRGRHMLVGLLLSTLALAGLGRVQRARHA